MFIDKQILRIKLQLLYLSINVFIFLRLFFFFDTHSQITIIVSWTLFYFYRRLAQKHVISNTCSLANFHWIVFAVFTIFYAWLLHCYVCDFFNARLFRGFVLLVKYRNGTTVNKVNTYSK